MKKPLDHLLPYYLQELEELRTLGQEFATRFPNVAQYLDLGKQASNDPHVERLLESFAFLTGRLQRQMDELAPETASSLLNLLYPSFTRPIPAMALFCFDVDIDQCAQAPGTCVPSGSTLFATRSDGAVCYFRTSHDLLLWPLQILSIDMVAPDAPLMVAPDYLHLRLRWGGPAGQGPKHLRFYLQGEEAQRHLLYRSLFFPDFPVLLKTESSLQPLAPLRPIGFTEEESLLPTPHEEHRGFRLLEEYFALPQKFLGGHIDGIPAAAWQETLSLYLPLKISSEESLKVSSSSIGFHCVPGINLFEVVSEPLVLDYTQTEMLIVPDQRRYDAQEVYSLSRVIGVSADTAEEEDIPPYYAETYDTSQREPTLFWTVRRIPAKQGSGTDVLLSVINTNLDPTRNEQKTLYVHTLCTNREATRDIPAEGAFQIEQTLPIKALFCTERPTDPRAPHGQGETLWQLVSFLSLESLSFVEEEETLLQRLKELLRVLSKRITPVHQEIRTISALSCRPSTRRLGRDGWRGFVPGQEISLEVRELGQATNPLLLGKVLSEFFRSYTSYNSFVETTLQDPGKGRKTWPPQFGLQHNL
ncbi:MAG: type VI secretion system baseplate subunit TssF [Holosporales bacterium]|jgi:type VI secretion system protein ImpG|nr:type VI secretion system baseplate subunit TssF [Holosporales bacterium]